MLLADLAKGDDHDLTGLAELGNTDITGLTSDSRKVKPGNLFAAFPGGRADGREFIAEALGRGAAAVLAPTGTQLHPPGLQVRLVTAENPRRAFALMAARFFRSQPATIAAVTGTNGKTSTVSFARQIWTHLGRAAASLGTIGISGPGIDVPGSLTTPDPVDLHRALHELAEAGVDHLAMEASSHGLSQYRLDGVRIGVAAFTNLTRDHLDYHRTMEGYAAAKLRLFTELTAGGGAAVINADDSFAGTFIEAARARGLRVLTYGTRGEDLHIDSAEPLPDGQRVRMTVLGRTFDLTLPLVGAFQTSNVLCALGLVIASGEDAEAALAALPTLTGVHGRLQRIGEGPHGAPIFVDYAHTPDALEVVLKTMRPHVAGRLHVVFGCGGDRDPGKRPQMGRIAIECADVVTVTDDNPRTEDAAAIRKEIMVACPGAREVGDRRTAIFQAVADLTAGDALVVAGKGHESGQIVGAQILPFDDAEVVREAIGEALG